MNKKVGIMLLEYWIKEHSLITYGELAKQVGVSERHVADYLEEVSFACIVKGLPPISAIVVNAYTRMCGDGFFKVYYPNEPKEKWLEIYVNDVKRILEYQKWDEFLEEFKMKGETKCHT